MSQEPKISVIIPVYNTEKYLKECLDSVIGQSLKDIEIIVINDGSPDNSIQIIHEYEHKDSRIVVIDKKNEGVGKARNDGIKAATGEFIAFMDSDDLYANSSALEHLYIAAKEKNVRVAGGKKQMLQMNGELIYSDEELCQGLRFTADGVTAYSDYQYDYGYWQYIYNRRMLIDNDVYFPHYSRFQDPPFFVKAMHLAGKFYMTCDCVYTYRLIPSESKYTLKKTIDFLHGIRDNLIFSKENKLEKLHFLTAYRLNSEGSFMAEKCLLDRSNNCTELLYWLIQTNALIDQEWLREKKLLHQEPFVLDVFSFLANSAKKYDEIANNKAIRIIKKVIKRHGGL